MGSALGLSGSRVVGSDSKADATRIAAAREGERAATQPDEDRRGKPSTS